MSTYVKRKKKRSKFLGTVINPTHFHRSQIKFILIVLPLAILMLLPMLFIVSHAFKPFSELYAYPPKFFVRRPTLDSYRMLIKITSQSGVPLMRYAFNSLIQAAGVIFFTLFFGSMAAYSFSFLNYRGKKLLLGANQIAIMFVAVAVAVPRYFVMNRLGLINNYFSLIVPLIAMPVGVFLLKQFMDQIPRELIDASKIDGANNFQIYIKVIIPLVKPALATVAILSFQAAWNNTEASSLFVDDESLKTLAYYFSIMTLGNSALANQGISAAASLIMFLPNIIFFILVQNQVMNTMAYSGMK